jgi:hypothetical protein
MNVHSQQNMPDSPPSLPLPNLLSTPVQREVGKKAMYEEKAPKDKDRRKRPQEGREREQERERKKKEKKDGTRKEREERERKALEEREARLAEKREERERLRRRKRESGEGSTAKEKLAAQQRSTAAASFQWER